MRYAVTALLVLGLGITVMAPVAFAQVYFPPTSTLVCPLIGPCYGPHGDQVVPLEPGATGGGGGACYVDGVARSCTQPAPMTMPTPSGSGSGVAGGSKVCPLIGQCYEPRN
jgi:hypothetical protein